MEGVVIAPPGAPVGSLIEEDMQIEWKGMRFGPNTWMGYKNLTGWEDMPSLDASWVPFPHNHGTWPGPMYGNEKIITFDSQIYAPNEQEFVQLKRELDLRSSIEQEESPLVIRQHGETLMMNARLTGRQMPINRAYFLYHPRVTLQWTASDARRYSLEEQSLTLSPPQIEGGLPWDAGLDWIPGLDWGTLSSSGTGTLYSNGTTDTSPVLTFVGPLTAPYTVVSDAGWILTFVDSLPVGSTAVADVKSGTFAVNGVDALYALDPTANIIEEAVIKRGSNTLNLLSNDVGSSTGTMTVTWRDAFN